MMEVEKFFFEIKIIACIYADTYNINLIKAENWFENNVATSNGG